jgi:class 3 adenylate cyclase
MSADRHVRLAVMFTDIQGFSAMMSADEATTVRVVREHRVIVREGLAEHGGRELRTIGDAFLVVFDGAADAVRCAVTVQRRLAARNAGLPAGEQVWVRIGLHWGDVLIGGEGELYGEAVNIAARVEPHAPAGGICATEALHRALGDELGAPWQSVGVVPLKNIPHAIALFRATIAGPSPGATAADLTFASVVPAATTRVVGREAELEDLHRRLLDGERLITLLGPGGVGKTTLLAELGRTVGPGWSGGVWFVELAAATDLAGVGSAVAAVLGVAPGSDPIAAVGTALRARGRTLLLLDNAEQATAAVGQAVAAWRARAPDATFGVTSRERLGLQDERIVPIDGLTQDRAVALFAERASAVRPDFDPAAERAAVERIVDRLDRMPLAIELFATRLRLEPLPRLLERLDAHLDLRAARRDGPARQATLRATIAWSWALLAPEERTALARLTVFRGPIPLDAAAHVVRDEAIVESLVDKSLLRSTADGLAFYESIRAFAAEHLAPDDDAPDRHAAWFLARWATAKPGDLRRHREDLPLVFRTRLTRGDGDGAARAWLAWFENGRADTPIRVHVDAAARVPELADDALAARFDRTRSAAALDVGDAAAAEVLAERAIARARSAGDPDGLALALRQLGTVYVFTSRLEAARVVCEESLGSATEPLAQMQALQTLALSWGVLDTDRFRELNDAARVIAEQIGHEIAVVVARHNHALTVLGEGRIDDAAATFRENVAVTRRLGEALHLAAALCGLGHCACAAGDFATARAAAQEGLVRARAFGLPRWHGANLVVLAIAQAGLGEIVASSTISETLRVLEAAGDPREVLLARTAEAWVLALLGRVDDGRARLRPISDELAAMCLDPRTLLGAVHHGARRACGLADGSPGVHGGGAIAP